MFAPQHQTLVMSSFALWLNNLLIQKGGYINVGTKFYPTNIVYSNYTTFSSPYKPIIFDTSYSGPTTFTGVYFNNSFLTLHQSGYAGIDYNRGNVYFTGSNTPSFVSATVSGSYSIPEYNVLFPAPDVGMIFEGKMNLRPKSSLNNPVSGLGQNDITYPVIFVRNEGNVNEPFTFGGTDLTTTSIGLYIFSDSQYSLDCVRSILVDQKTNYLSIIPTGDMPTNNINFLKNGALFNYTGIANLAGQIGSGTALYIKDVIITDFTRKGLFSEVASLPTDVYFGVAEFEVCKARLT